MSGIFISYRRDDTTADAGRLFDDLQRRCAHNRVFWDAEIPPGPDYREVLSEKLVGCDIVLVLIGPEWLKVKDPTEPDSGRRRLDIEDDPVRIEIVTALANRKIIVPVLLRGAKMPGEKQLPALIRNLAYCNAFALRHDRWKLDVNELVKHFPRRLGCGQEIAYSWSWRLWADLFLIPTILLSGSHVFVVFNQSEVLRDMDWTIVAAALSFLLGAIYAFRFKALVWEKGLISFMISLASGILVSVIVPLYQRKSIIPTNWVEARLFVLYVTTVLVGYLVGTLTTDVVVSRGKVRVS